MLQQELIEWKNKYEEMKKMYNEMLIILEENKKNQKNHNNNNNHNNESFQIEDQSNIRDTKTDFTFVTAPNKSHISQISSVDTPTPWSPIHMEEEDQDLHELENDPERLKFLPQRKQQELNDISKSMIPHNNNDEKSIGSMSAFDVNDADSNANYLPDHHLVQQHQQNQQQQQNNHNNQYDEIEDLTEKERKELKKQNKYETK